MSLYGSEEEFIPVNVSFLALVSGNMRYKINTSDGRERQRGNCEINDLRVSYCKTGTATVSFF